MKSYDSPELFTGQPRVHTSDARCPVCGSYDIEGGSIEIIEDSAYQTVDCRDCKSSWKDRYLYDGTCELEFEDSYAGLSPDLYEKATLPNGMSFSYVTPSMLSDRRMRLFEKLRYIIHDLVDGPGSHMTVPRLRSIVEANVKQKRHITMSSVGTGNTVLTNAPWGYANVSLSSVDGCVQLAVNDDVCAIPLLIVTLVDETSNFVDPWSAIYDRVKCAQNPYFQEIFMGIDSALSKTSE